MKVKAHTTVTVNNRKHKPGDVFTAKAEDVKSFLGAGYVEEIPEPKKEESKPKKGKGKK